MLWTIDVRESEVQRLRMQGAGFRALAAFDEVLCSLRSVTAQECIDNFCQAFRVESEALDFCPWVSPADAASEAT